MHVPRRPSARRCWIISWNVFDLFTSRVRLELGRHLATLLRQVNGKLQWQMNVRCSGNDLVRNLALGLDLGGNIFLLPAGDDSPGQDQNQSELSLQWNAGYPMRNELHKTHLLGWNRILDWLVSLTLSTSIWHPEFLNLFWKQRQASKAESSALE